MRRRTVSILLHGFRAVVAVVALLGLLVLAIYQWQPSWVHAVDRWIEGRHFDPLNERLEQGQALLATEPDRGVEILRELAVELDGYDFGDRQGKLCAEAWRRLAQHYAGSENWQQAAEPAEAWRTLDPQNLEAWLLWGAVLAELPGRRTEAVTALQDLHRRLPEQWSLTERLLGLLAADGRWTDSGEILAAHLEAPRPGDWETFSRLRGARFPAHDFLVPHVGDDGRLWLSFDVPIGAEEIGLYLPRSRELALRDVELSLTLSGKATQLALDGPGIALDQLAWRDGVLRTGGSPRPRIVMRPPQPLPAGASMSFRATLVDLVPRPVADRLFDAGGQRMIDALRSDERPGPARRLEHTRAAAAVERPMWVYWHGPEEPFAAKRRASALPRRVGDATDGVPFAVELPVGQPAVELRIVLPPAVGRIFRIERLQLGAEDDVHTLAIDDLTVRGMHGMSCDLRQLLIEDRNPYFSFSLTSTRVVDFVRIEAVCR